MTSRVSGIHSALLPVGVMNTRAKISLGRRGYVASQRLQVHHGGQSRKELITGGGSRDHGGSLLTKTCSPWTTGIGHPQWAGSSYINPQSRECLTDLLTGQSDGGNPSTETPSSHMYQADNRSLPRQRIFNGKALEISQQGIWSSQDTTQPLWVLWVFISRAINFFQLPGLKTPQDIWKIP